MVLEFTCSFSPDSSQSRFTSLTRQVIASKTLLRTTAFCRRASNIFVEMKGLQISKGIKGNENDVLAAAGDPATNTTGVTASEPV